MAKPIIIILRFIASLPILSFYIYRPALVWLKHATGYSQFRGEALGKYLACRKLPAFLTLCAAIIAAGVLASLAEAAALPPAARVEIESMLSRLGASGCQFYRNGSWHASGEAQAHLRHKLDYLVEKGAIASTEQFIERAATKSSVSGQAYLVKCNGSAPVPSAMWLHAQLRDLRATLAAPAPSGIDPR